MFSLQDFVWGKYSALNNDICRQILLISADKLWNNDTCSIQLKEILKKIIYLLMPCLRKALHNFSWFISEVLIIKSEHAFWFENIIWTPTFSNTDIHVHVDRSVYNLHCTNNLRVTTLLMYFLKRWKTVLLDLL